MLKEKMLIKNWAITIVLKRAIFGTKKRTIIPRDIRHKKILPKRFNAQNYVNNKNKKWHLIISTIIKCTPNTGWILEAGCGTSALSIWLNKKGYANCAIDSDQDVLRIAATLNSKADAAVNYKVGYLFNIPYPEVSIQYFLMEQLSTLINKKLYAQ